MTPSSEKARLLVRSLAIAAGLTILKVVVFALTNAVTILASAVDSFLDFLVSALNFTLARSAAKPADRNHPYGHGKIESLAGLVQSLVIGAIGIAVLWMSARRILRPEPIREPLLGVGVVVVGLVLSLWHSRRLKASARKTDSAVMASEHLHYASDAMGYVAVLASLGLYRLTGSAVWDPFFSLLIVVYVLKSAGSIFTSARDELLDRQLPDTVLAELDRQIRGFHASVAGYHDLKTRKVGDRKFIEFHVVLRGIERFEEAHDITEGLVRRLRDKYPGASVTVHADPDGADDPPPSA